MECKYPHHNFALKHSNFVFQRHISRIVQCNAYYLNHYYLTSHDDVRRPRYPTQTLPWSTSDLTAQVCELFATYCD